MLVNLVFQDFLYSNINHKTPVQQGRNPKTEHLTIDNYRKLCYNKRIGYEKLHPLILTTQPPVNNKKIACKATFANSKKNDI